MKHTGEAIKRTAEMKAKLSNKAGFASGGRVKAYEGGAGSGVGRLEKTKSYGGNAKKK